MSSMALKQWLCASGIKAVGRILTSTIPKLGPVYMPQLPATLSPAWSCLYSTPVQSSGELFSGAVLWLRPLAITCKGNRFDSRSVPKCLSIRTLVTVVSAPENATEIRANQGPTPSVT